MFDKTTIVTPYTHVNITATNYRNKPVVELNLTSTTLSIVLLDIFLQYGTIQVRTTPGTIRSQEPTQAVWFDNTTVERFIQPDLDICRNRYCTGDRTQAVV